MYLSEFMTLISRVHPTSYRMGTSGSFPVDKAGREADHSPPSSG